MAKKQMEKAERQEIDGISLNRDLNIISSGIDGLWNYTFN
jgi:hypothetical protein